MDRSGDDDDLRRAASDSIGAATLATVMAKDFTKTREWKIFERHVRESVVPKISSSEVMVSIAASGEGLDVRQAVEIGAAMLLDKPIVLVVPEGRQAPARLVRVADKVIYASVNSEKGRQQILDGLRAYFKQ